MKFIKPLIPPLIWKNLKILLNKNSPSITYSGIYSSFQEVFDHYRSATNYNSEKSIQLELELAQKKYELFKNGKIPNLDWANCRRNLFSAILSYFENIQPIRILDIGGGLGASFIDIKYSCPNINTEFTIFERPVVVEKGSEFSRQYSELQFISELPSRNNYDICLFGSSLQYFENYKEILNTVCSYNPKLIILLDHPMGSVDAFVCAQVNMIDRVIPGYVFNLDEIYEIFKENGYRIKLKSVNYYPFHNFLNYEGEYEECQHYNLVFNKITETTP